MSFVTWSQTLFFRFSGSVLGRREDGIPLEESRIVTLSLNGDYEDGMYYSVW